MAQLTYRVTYAIDPIVRCGNKVGNKEDEGTTWSYGCGAGFFVLTAVCGSGAPACLGFARAMTVDRGWKIRSEGKMGVR